jgi:hypothetical protein
MIIKPSNIDYRLADYKGENKTFQKQQKESFTGATGFADLNNQFYTDMTNMMGERFGRQSQTMDIMTGALSNIMGNGPGAYNYSDDAGNPVAPGTPGAMRSGPNGAGGNLGGGRSGPNGAGAAMRAAREGGGGGGGGAPADPFAGVDINSGFQEGDYALPQFAKGYGRMERAMRSEASEGTARNYQNAMDANRAQAIQSGFRGMPGSGLEQAMMQKAQFAQAAQEGDAARQIAIEMMNRKAQDSRQSQQLATQLGIAKGGARQQTSQWETGINLQMAQQRAAAANAAAARGAAMRMAAQRNSAMQRASGAASRAYSQAARTMSAGQAKQFAEEMRLKGAQLSSDNFFRGMGVLTGAMNAQSPLDYARLGLGGLGQGGDTYGNLYNTSSKGMVETKGGGFWSKLLNAAVGGGLGVLTGGMSTLAGAAMGRLGGGGGGGGRSASQMGPWESAAYNNGNPSNYGPGY